MEPSAKPVPSSPVPAEQREPGEPTVADNPAASRYELHVNSVLAGFSDYRLRGNAMSITHTEVKPAFQGAHLATRLTRFSLDDARKRGLDVLPYCPYTSAWIRKHPDYIDLVPQDRRASFGLA